MPTLNTTPNRAYQEPFVGNDLTTDVGRIISALRAIDTDVSDAFAQIVAKAGLASPAFTGTPTAPTAAPGDDSNKIANTAFVRAALSALVGMAPEALDTLEELAAKAEDNSDLIDLLEAAIAAKADAAATTTALADKAALLSSGASDNTFDDTDELAYVTGTTQKRGTLTGLIASIFKTTRKIANVVVDATNFKIRNAGGFDLSFDTTGLTAGLDYDVRRLPTPMVSWVPTFTGFGVVDQISMFSWREGDRLKGRGRFRVGTPTAVEARMSLGFNGVDGGLTIDATKVPSIRECGFAVYDQVLAAAAVPTILMEGGVGYLTFGLQSTSFAGLAKRNGNVFASSTWTISLEFDVPITGW